MILCKSFVGPQGDGLKIEDSGLNVASFTAIADRVLFLWTCNGKKAPNARKVDKESCDA